MTRRRLSMWRRAARSLIIAVPAVALAIVLIGPFLMVVVGSISTDRDLNAIPPELWPRHPTLSHYELLLGGKEYVSIAAGEFPRALANTVIVGAAVTLACLVIGSLAAYAFLRLHFAGRRALFLGVIFAQMLPPVAVVIPMYVLAAALGLLNTLQGLIIVYSSFTLPFVVWVMRGYFQTIPRELEEAASLDGCSPIGVLRHVVLPLSLPGSVAAAIFALLGVWGEFLLALVINSTPETKMLTVVVSEFVTRYGENYGPMAAAAVIASLPPLILVAFVQRYLVSGMTAGASKG